MELATASTEIPAALTPNYYVSPDVLEAEQELIFERTWQLAGHVGRLPNSGSYITAQAGSQPVLIVRDKDFKLRAYRNVCRHRASRLLSGSGQCKGAIRCRYHGWTYRFDGSLIGVPEALTFGERLDKSALSLHPVRLEEMCGLIFVNLDPDATPMAELVGDLPKRLERFQIPTLERFGPWGDEPSGDGQPANWKIVVENYIEGYHIPIAHPGLMRMLDYKHYDVEVSENYVWFEAPFRSKASSNRMERLYGQLASPMPGLTEEDRAVWRYVFIYPNTTIDLYPDQIATWQILPNGIQRTSDIWASSSPTSNAACRRAGMSAVRCRGARRQSPGSPSASAPTWRASYPRRERGGSAAARSQAEGPRTHPGRGGAADRSRGDR
jgi:phenylpropionate dioxygenase-like ring-hydroxylating dioxygenase large terminal subunit